MCTPDLSLCPIIPFITFLKFSTESEFCLESESGITINCHVSLVSFNLQWFLSLSFLTVMSLKSIGQLVCRLALNLGLSDVSSWLDLDHYIFGRNTTELCPSLCIIPEDTWCLFVPKSVILTLITCFLHYNISPCPLWN